MHAITVTALLPWTSFAAPRSAPRCRQLATLRTTRPLCGLREAGDEAHSSKKRHVALMFGFRGTGFYGLQSQSAEGTPGQPTVSDALRRALLDAGAVLPSNFSPLTRTKWTLASRTDKGVHAARAAVSLKMETLDSQLEPLLSPLLDTSGTLPGQFEPLLSPLEPAERAAGPPPQPRLALIAAAVAEINSHLPPEVRLSRCLPAISRLSLGCLSAVSRLSLSAVSRTSPPEGASLRRLHGPQVVPLPRVRLEPQLRVPAAGLCAWRDGRGGVRRRPLDIRREPQGAPLLLLEQLRQSSGPAPSLTATDRHATQGAQLLLRPARQGLGLLGARRRELAARPRSIAAAGRAPRPPEISPQTARDLSSTPLSTTPLSTTPLSQIQAHLAGQAPRSRTARSSSAACTAPSCCEGRSTSSSASPASPSCCTRSGEMQPRCSGERCCTRSSEMQPR